MNQQTLNTLHQDSIRFVQDRQTHGTPFGHFNHCQHAFAKDELSALTVGLELWKMLGIPLSDTDLTYTHQPMQDMQSAETGLMIDPSWEGRLRPEGDSMLVSGDTFFTRCTICALWAWDRQLIHPVAYLQALNPSQLLPCIYWGRGGHAHFTLWDLAVLLTHNQHIAAPGADQLFHSFLKAVEAKQDPATGLWLNGDPAEALTPSINCSFHTV